MKRIVIVSILLALCITISAYADHRVTDDTNVVNFNVDGALDALSRGDQDELTMHVNTLIAFWNEEEDKLIRLVRHAAIDDITKSVARLEALNESKVYSELAAELSSIRWQMDHIYHSEQLLPQNLL